MKKYKINKIIVLGFLAPDGSFDVMIDPKSLQILEADDHTIWLVNGDIRHESINTISAISRWLEQGSIEEIK